MKTSNCPSDQNKNKKKTKGKKGGYGLIDYIVNRLPEIHIPGYQYCGPGTELEKRLARGDPGINKLDEACKDHDIAYSECTDTKSRRKADNALVARAFKRVYSQDANLSERAAALLVSGIMSTKMGLTKIGLGLGGSGMRVRKKKKKARAKVMRKSKRNSTRAKSKRKPSTSRKSITFGKLVQAARSGIKRAKVKSSASLSSTVKAAVKHMRDMKGSKIVKMSRVLKLPKFGGSILSILPILSGLSAIGSITSSAVGVAKAIKDIENAKKLLSKSNMNGERRIGNGLSLIYKAKGSGFYLKPSHQPQRR